MTHKCHAKQWPTNKLKLEILFLFMNLGAHGCAPEPNLVEPEPWCAGSGATTGCTKPQCSGAGSSKIAQT